MPTDKEPAVRVLEETAQSDTIERIHQLLSEVFASNPVDDIDAMQFELALAEIGANIVEHARKNDGAEVTIHLELQISSESIEARFSDDGRPARVDLKNVALPDDFAERGRGLAIALTVLDELSYRRSDGKNRWLLIRNRTDQQR
jgi:serine/threonine-protein kinase RsbW